MKKITCINIISMYCDKYMFLKTTDRNKFWAMEKCNRIGIPTTALDSSTPENVFRLLHEIGHCETYKQGQFKAQREYLATQWAIDKCKELNIEPHKEHDLWQNYIFSFTKAKDKSKYLLKW